MAIGIVLGAAFGAIVTSFVSDLLMPPIGLLLGRVDFSDLFIPLTGRHFDSVAAGQSCGRGDAELRPVYEHRDQLRDHRVRHILAGASGKQTAAETRPGTGCSSD